MVHIVLEGINTSILLEYLGIYSDLDWKKTWSFEGMLIGFFEYKPKMYSGDCVLNVIVESDELTRQCHIQIHAHGGSGSMRSWNILEQFLGEFRRSLINLAEKNQWSYLIEKLHYKGEKCPHCGAYYHYSEEKIMDDRSVICQNCAKRFRIGEESRDPVIAEIGEALRDRSSGN